MWRRLTEESVRPFAARTLRPADARTSMPSMPRSTIHGKIPPWMESCRASEADVPMIEASLTSAVDISSTFSIFRVEHAWRLVPKVLVEQYVQRMHQATRILLRRAAVADC